MAHLWRGVLEEYRDRLPLGPHTPVVTLGEGGTPLTYARTLSARTGWVRSSTHVSGRLAGIHA